MTRSRLTWISLFLVFAMLWLPLGQYPFLIEHWMKVGTFMAPFLLMVAFAFTGTSKDEEPVQMDARLIALSLLLTYIVHQFEEHWVDLFGNNYAFQPTVDALLRTVVGAGDTDVTILTTESVFVINTTLVWLVGALAIATAGRAIFPTLAMCAIVLINGISHIVAALAQTSYNPGLVTSIVLFIPLSLAFYRLLAKKGLASTGLIALSLIWGILGHIIMLGGVVAANWLGILPELVYFAALVVWSIVPSLVPVRSSPA